MCDDSHGYYEYSLVVYRKVVWSFNRSVSNSNMNFAHSKCIVGAFAPLTRVEE